MGFGVEKVSLVFGKVGKNLKKGLTSTEKSARQARKQNKQLVRYERNYFNAHNRLAESISLRNQAQAKLTTKALNLSTEESIQRVGLSLADKALATRAVRREVDSLLNPIGLNSEFGKGINTGIAGTKAQAQGLNPQKYLKPTVGNYLQTGSKTLGMTSDLGKTVIHQKRVTKNALYFGKAEKKLHDTRLAVLANEQGAFQSEEELAAMLLKSKPASNISRKDIKLHQPGPNSILPGKSPEKLPKASATPQDTAVNLSPQQKVHKEMAERDLRITRLNEDLRKQDPKALNQAIQERDYYQVKTVMDVSTGILNAPAEAGIVASNMVYKYIPKATSAKPLYQPITVQKAEYELGQSIGAKVGRGNGEKFLQAQVNVETRHAAGRETAMELKDLHKQKVLEADRNLVVDKDGDKFYDTFQSPRESQLADSRYETIARQNLPRPEDQLYLQKDVVPIVPSTIWEGIRRPLNAWFNPPT